MKCFMGLDGGGTKTECVILNDAGTIVARSKGPASNPTRIGFLAAFLALKQSCDAALNFTHPSFEVVALCAGLAGTGRAENRDRMRQFLSKQFPDSLVEVRTDLELPLFAMPPGPAIVLVVGTGSAAIGRDAFGAIRREGGWGPTGSDEGSAFNIGQLAVEAARAEPSSESEELSRQILRHLGCSNWNDLDSKAAGNADAIYPRIFPVVAAAADAGNTLAQALLNSAAAKLATISHGLAQSLALDQQPFPLGKIGGTVGRSRFFDQAIDREVRRMLPNAMVSVLKVEPAEIAARIALRNFRPIEGGPQ
jgi:N-acetylglucosamine kinase-like BadF-type ATPase